MDPRYPIGHYQAPATITADQLSAWLRDFRQLPADFRQKAEALDQAGKLDLPYRPGGWTGRQVVHHVADSHLNAYVRFKLGLTEENPTVRPYEEGQWALLPDNSMAARVSLDLLDQLHARLAATLSELTTEQWQRTFYHPGNDATVTLAYNLGMYVWHGRHHLAHLELID